MESVESRGAAKGLIYVALHGPPWLILVRGLQGGRRWSLFPEIPT
jgi:hypothetical protein